MRAGSIGTFTFALSALCLVASPVATQQRSISELVSEYRRGNANAAVTELSRWSTERLLSDGDTESFRDPWDDAALALLHMEAGLQRGTLQIHSVLHSGALSAGAAHGRAGLAGASRALRKRNDETRAGIETFARTFEIALGSVTSRLLYNLSDAASRPDDLLRVSKSLPTDARLRLFVGSTLTSGMGPDVQERDGYHRAQVFSTKALEPGETQRLTSSPYGVFNAEYVRLAEGALRDAIRLQPDLTEARLRLGHLLMLLGRTADAKRELTAAGTHARGRRQSFEGYLAHLFLGHALEREGRLNAAVQAYANASAFKPRAPAARIATGQALLTAGFVSGGWGAIRSVFGEASGGLPPDIDPWVWFPYAQFWRFRDDLSALRSMVRRDAPAPRAAMAADFPDAVATLLPPPDTTAPTPESIEAAPRPMFAGRTEGVRIDVVVTLDGRPVTGLQSEDFEVLDNGIRQSVTAASSVANLNVGVVLDTSYSVGGLADTPVTLGNRILQLLTPADRYTVVGADDAIALLVPLSPARSIVQLPQPHRRVTQTALWDGTLAAASLLLNEPGRPVVVVVSDMADNVSWSGLNWMSERPRLQRDRITEAFRASGIVLDLISVPEWYVDREKDGLDRWSSSDNWVGSRAGSEMAAPTGGVQLNATASGMLDRLRAHFDLVRSGYVLTFQSKGVPAGDGWHKLTVRLRGKRGEVIARPGYHSPRALRQPIRQ